MRRFFLILCLATLATAGAMGQSRSRVLMDKDWHFAFGNASSPEKDYGCGTEYFNYLTKANSVHNAGPYSPKFDDSKWQSVDLPHDFVVGLPFAKEASHSHGYKTVGYKYPETSVGWYRKTFSVDESLRGSHVWIEFEGIFRDSRVWVNGFYVGGEPSGYVGQSYDISDYLNYGGDNLVCVRADATLEEGWFYEGGGIYRHVWLNSAGTLHVAPDGIRSASVVARDFLSATVDVEADIVNDGDEASPSASSCRFELYNGQGELVAASDRIGIESLLPRHESTCKASLRVTKPQLWDVDAPNLYTLRTLVYNNEKESDRIDTKIGIRTVIFSADEGMFVNGCHLKIKGFCQHQDHAGVGAAISDELQVWRLQQLKKLGANAIRTSHNPASPSLLAACDSLGILVVEENRLAGTSQYQISQLKSMIWRDYNHPSIIAWSMCNEEWGMEHDQRGTDIVRTMCQYAHSFDPTRPATCATSGGPAPVIDADLAGYNYILQNPVEEHRRKYPDRIAYGSEETTGCGGRGVYFDDHANGYTTAINRHKQGPDSLYNCIERGWKFYDERPYMVGLFYWTGFDYRGESNPMVFPATNSQFGVLDYCGFPKDEAYYLKAWWSDEPVLHVLPHWNLQGHEGDSISVWVYSNCDEVELSANGRKLGRKAMPTDGHLEWTAVYKAGKLVATGYKDGKKVASQTVVTTGEPYQAVAETDRVGRLSVVNVRIVDKKGQTVPTACVPVRLTIDGNARILGAGNGDPAWQAKEQPDSAADRSFTVCSFNGLAQFLVEADSAEETVAISVAMEQ